MPMIRLDAQSIQDLRSAVARAQGHAHLAERLHAMYARLEDAITLRGPRCDASGRCCRFEEFGHRLFLTTIELAVFTRQLALESGVAREQWNGQGCPYQVDGLCGVRAIRPFGCRIYFCDPSSTDWQSAHYEDFQSHVRRLHEELDIPYFYVEWREGLRAAAGLAG